MSIKQGGFLVEIGRVQVKMLYFSSGLWYNNFVSNIDLLGELIEMKKYDVTIVGGGAGGLFAAYEFIKQRPETSVCLLEKGAPLEKRNCPIDGKKIKNCIGCNHCSITTGIGGAGAFSDGKYNITNNFGGDFHQYVGEQTAIELMEYVDEINLQFGGEGAKKYSTVGSDIKRRALQYDLHMLDAQVRHLGTERNYFILKNLIEHISKNVEIRYYTEVENVERSGDGWRVTCKDGDDVESKYVIIAAGRSGSKWTGELCERFGIVNSNNRVDIGIRFECPAEIWEPITDSVYESKIMYRSPKTRSVCRTFCMNPHGEVVAENTNGIVTVNGHSYDDPALYTANTNFALLVTHKFTDPFKNSNAYGEHVAALANMLAGGVMVQRFGDLLEDRRTNPKRLLESFTRPTLDATPGNLALCMPKATLDTIIEMIFALDKLVPGTANFDNLLYGTEVKFYNSRVELDEHLESKEKGLFFIGDSSGTTHSLSQASAEGVYVSRYISKLLSE